MIEININSILGNKELSKFQITENFICIRFIDQTKERFELEFNLEKGTSFNTFFIISEKELFVVHPPEKRYLSSFKKIISIFCNQLPVNKIRSLLLSAKSFNSQAGSSFAFPLR